MRQDSFGHAGAQGIDRRIVDRDDATSPCLLRVTRSLMDRFLRRLWIDLVVVLFCGCGSLPIARLVRAIMGDASEDWLAAIAPATKARITAPAVV